jgi:hypothetical protein
LHLFKSSTLCRRPGRYAGGSSSGPRPTVMQFCAVPDFRRHPEYHIAREEMIRSLPIPSSEVAYLVRSRAMSARRQKWKAEMAKLKNATPSA